jgi:hypothetical protein
MNAHRKRKPIRLPPTWVRRADWRWEGARPAFAFPHVDDDPDVEGAMLDNLAHYADSHPTVFWNWIDKIDRHRGPELNCLCPQCIAAQEGHEHHPHLLQVQLGAVVGA